MKLRRAAAVAAILLLALPGVAAADDSGTDGLIINGTNLVTLVDGQDAPGAISVRFADDPMHALFYENGWSFNGVTPTAPGEFAVHEAGTAYSSDAGNYTAGAAPALSGQGTVASPWLVTSGFSTPDLSIAQTVSHVDGSRALTLAWTVTNASGASVPFSAFWSADLYVAGSDEGVGALVAGPPRILQGIAIDGTKAGLVELTPWSHWFEGGYWPSTVVDSNAGAAYNDSFDPTSVDNGLGVQWDRTLAAGASTTFVLGFTASEPGGAPVPAVAPDITRSPISGPSDTAAFGFAAHAGDTATVAFECSLDGGLYDPCSSPATYTGLALGGHVLRVHGVNADGDFGPAATARWTVTPLVVASHPRVGLPDVAPAGRSIKVGCSLAVGRIARCSVTLKTPGGVVIGRAVRAFHGYHQSRHGMVEVVLTRTGRRLADQLGGVHIDATVSVLPAGGSRPLVARRSVHVVASRVDVTPPALQFRSGSAVLLPSGRTYLLDLIPKLHGARRLVATGYTDSVGSAAANYRLGLARADAVCAFVSGRARLACRALAYGESHPRATNTTAAGRARNRRVELEVTY